MKPCQSAMCSPAKKTRPNRLRSALRTVNHWPGRGRRLEKTVESDGLNVVGAPVQAIGVGHVFHNPVFQFVLRRRCDVNRFVSHSVTAQNTLGAFLPEG